MATNKALNKSYTYATSAPYDADGYRDEGGIMLTDGLVPSVVNNYSVYIYPMNTTVVVTIDLLANKVLSYFRINYMVYQAPRVYAPSSIDVYGKVDGGSTFNFLGTFAQDGNWTATDNYWTGAWTNNLTISGTYRYIQLNINRDSQPKEITLKEIEIYADDVSSSSIKTVNGLAKASIKIVNALAIASVKTINGLA